MNTPRTIDLNSDMGESLNALNDGTEEQLMKLVTSANIACGYHAGDDRTMEESVRLAIKYDVGIGAHPGYPDRKNFGRISMKLSASEITDLVTKQITAFGKFVRANGGQIVHLKPHGALYSDAARDRAVAQAVAEGARAWNKDLILVGLAGSVMLDVWKDMGFTVAAEAFADRRYEPDGTLRSRKFNDALITDPDRAAEQALGIVRRGVVETSSQSEIALAAETICVHSDTPGAVAIAGTLKKRFDQEGILFRSLEERFSTE
jgi:UPF0271 protein